MPLKLKVAQKKHIMPNKNRDKSKTKILFEKCPKSKQFVFAFGNENFNKALL